MQYAHDEMPSGANESRLTSITYPDGYVLSYNYSSGLNSTISRLSSLSDSTGTLESYSYMGLGTVVVRSHPQINVDLTYVGTPGDAGDEYAGLDRFGRVVEQLWVNTSTSTVLDDFQYTYDVLGNRTAIDNGVDSSFNHAFTYDDLSQLTGFTQGTHTQDFDYDAVGNATSVTTDGSEQDRTANAQNQITSISGATTPTYDVNGNMLTDETGRQFVFDAWNHLVIVISSGGTTLETFTYDGLGRRVTSNDGTTTTDLYYSTQGQVLEEMQGGSATARYVWSPVYVNALVLRDRATGSPGTLDERLWAQQDANFNVTALVDSTGAVVERYGYSPFGTVTIYTASYTLRSSSSYAMNILFQGMRYDATSGLYEADARWYSATLMRWISNDPMRFMGEDVNLYRALQNNPSTHSDPKGQTVMTVGVGGQFVFVAGAGLSVVFAWDSCGNYGYFLVMSPRLGAYAGAGVEGGIYSGNLEDFENSITVSGEGELPLVPLGLGFDFDLHGKTFGFRESLGPGIGASVGVTFTGLLKVLPHVTGKKCSPFMNKEIPLPPFLAVNAACPLGLARPGPHFGLPLPPVTPASTVGFGSTIGGMTGGSVGTTIGTTLGGPLGGRLGGNLGAGIGTKVGGALDDIISLF